MCGSGKSQAKETSEESFTSQHWSKWVFRSSSGASQGYPLLLADGLIAHPSCQRCPIRPQRYGMCTKLDSSETDHTKGKSSQRQEMMEILCFGSPPKTTPRALVKMGQRIRKPGESSTCADHLDLRSMIWLGRQMQCSS